MITWVIIMQELYDLKILAVDDEAAICGMIREILCGAGFRLVQTAQSCAQARRVYVDFAPDAVVLDVMLPDGDGFSLMQKIRMRSQTPVLFLSARDEDNDRLLGLGLGADDYMTKPFLPRELVLRITAILRRTWFPPVRQEQTSEILKLGKKCVDFSAGTVTDGNESCALTAKELAILKKLYENRGNIVTFDILCNTVWGDEYYGYENTLMVHIRRLREKIEENPSKPEWLLTVRGLGYRLAKEHSSKERAL